MAAKQVHVFIKDIEHDSMIAIESRGPRRLLVGEDDDAPLEVARDGAVLDVDSAHRLAGQLLEGHRRQVVVRLVAAAPPLFGQCVESRNLLERRRNDRCTTCPMCAPLSISAGLSGKSILCLHMYIS